MSILKMYHQDVHPLAKATGMQAYPHTYHMPTQQETTMLDQLFPGTWEQVSNRL